MKYNVIQMFICVCIVSAYNLYGQAPVTPFQMKALKDGILLQVGVDTSVSRWEDVKVNCSLKNTTNQIIPYENSIETSGLEIRVIGQDGRLIPYTDEGKYTFLPGFKHTTTQMKPGEMIDFHFNLCETFDSHDFANCRMDVAWDRGIGEMVDRKNIAKGLTVSLTFPRSLPYAPKVDQTSPLTQQPRTEHLESVPTDRIPPGIQQTNITPSTRVTSSNEHGWLVWLFVVIAATVGAVWLLMRKSK